MSNSNYLSPNDYNGICDRCGRKFKFSQLKKTWDNLWVCPGDWEPRQPQDLIKGVPDNQSVPVSRPPPPPIFTPWHYTPSVIDTLSLVEQIGANLRVEIYDRLPRGAINTMGINRSSINGTFIAVEPSDREMLHLTEDIAVIATGHVPELNPDNIGFSDKLVGTLGVGLHNTLSLVEQIGANLRVEIYDRLPRGAVNSMGINRSSINGTFTAVEPSDREILHLTEDIAVIETDHVPELNPDNVGFSDRLIGTLSVGLHNTLNIEEQVTLNLNISAGRDKIGFTDTNQANIRPSLLDSLAFNDKLVGTLGVGLHNTLNIGEQVRLNLNTSAGSDKIGFTDTNNANISPSLLDSLAFNETVYILKIAGTINGSRINTRSINR